MNLTSLLNDTTEFHSFTQEDGPKQNSVIEKNFVFEEYLQKTSKDEGGDSFEDVGSPSIL